MVRVELIAHWTRPPVRILNMAAKKKKRKPKTPPEVSTYVSERIRELSSEHGWDPESVEKIVTKPKGKKP